MVLPQPPALHASSARCLRMSCWWAEIRRRMRPAEACPIPQGRRARCGGSSQRSAPPGPNGCSSSPPIFPWSRPPCCLEWWRGRGPRSWFHDRAVWPSPCARSTSGTWHSAPLWPAFRPVSSQPRVCFRPFKPPIWKTRISPSSIRREPPLPTSTHLRIWRGPKRSSPAPGSADAGGSERELDPAHPDQRPHHDDERDSIPAEGCEAMAVQEGDQPAHRDGRRDGGHHEPQKASLHPKLLEQVRCPVLRGFVEVLRELVQAGTAQGGQPQQERELRGFGRAHADQKTRADGHHGTGGAGPERGALQEPDPERIARREVPHGPGLRPAAPVEPDHPDAAHEERGEHRGRIEEVSLDRFVDQEAEYRSREEGEEKVQGELETRRILPQEPKQETADPRRVETHHRQDGPALDHHLKRVERGARSLVFPQPKQRRSQDEVARR